MTHLGKHSGTLLLRTPLLPGAFLAFYVVLHGYLLNQTSWLDYGEIGVFLTSSQSVGLLLFLLFSFLSFEFLFQERAVSLEECLKANPGAHRSFRWHQLGWMVPLVLVSSATVLGYDLWAAASVASLTSMVVRHLVLACVLNILLVEVIAVLLGSVLASGASRPLAYCLIIVAAFLTSPMAKSMTALLSGTALDGTYLTDFFSIVAPDTDWAPDPIYGLPIEACRWALALFWCALLLALFLLLNRPKGQKRHLIPVGVLLALAILGGVGFVQTADGSVVRLDERLWSTAFRELSYWATQESKEEAADFQVLSYQLDLSVKSKLSAESVVTVTQNQVSDHYLFTLYRGYTITSVTDQQGTPLDYTRDGDYLDVVYPLTEQAGEIRLSYQGSGSKYYSNYQGIALPGYFPWYPMAGYLKLWDSDTSSTYVNIPTDSKSFYVTVDSDLPLVSNLEEVAVIFPDHILLNTQVALTYAVLDKLIPEKSGADQLRDLLIWYLWDQDYLEEPKYSYDSALEGVLPSEAELAALSEDSDAEFSEVYEATQALERLLRYDIGVHGGDTVLRACYDYLCSDDTQNQVEFLYALAQTEEGETW